MQGGQCQLTREAALSVLLREAEHRVGRGMPRPTLIRLSENGGVVVERLLSSNRLDKRSIEKLFQGDFFLDSTYLELLLNDLGDHLIGDLTVERK